MGGQQLAVSGCHWCVERSGPGWRGGPRAKQRQETALPQREGDGDKLPADVQFLLTITRQPVVETLFLARDCASH